MFNRQAADSDGGGGAAVRLSAPLSRALRVWVFFFSLSLSLCRRRSRVAGFQRWQATLFFSDVIVAAPPSSDGQHHNSILLRLCFLFIFLNAKVQQPCTSNKNIFHICFDTSVWERAHWKMFPLEKLTACPVAHCVTVCSVQPDVAASFCNQTRIHMRPRTSEKRFRREFLKSAAAVLCKALIFNL